MNIDTNCIVTATEANQNFSRVARLAEEKGRVPRPTMRVTRSSPAMHASYSITIKSSLTPSPNRTEAIICWSRARMARDRMH